MQNECGGVYFYYEQGVKLEPYEAGVGHIGLNIDQQNWERLQQDVKNCFILLIFMVNTDACRDCALEGDHLTLVGQGVDREMLSVRNMLQYSMAFPQATLALS